MLVDDELPRPMEYHPAWKLVKIELLFLLWKKQNECTFKNMLLYKFIQYDGALIYANLHLHIQVHARKVELELVYLMWLQEEQVAPCTRSWAPPVQCTHIDLVASRAIENPLVWECNEHWSKCREHHNWTLPPIFMVIMEKHPKQHTDDE